MKKKGVLILCQYFYPEYVSSATLPMEMAEDLVKNGIPVGVLCGYPKEYLKKGSAGIPLKEVYRGIHIRRVKYFQLRRERRFGRLVNQLSFMLMVILCWPFLIKYKCIVVYSDPPMIPLVCVLMKKVFGIKFVFVVYDIYPDIAIVTNTVKSNSIMALIMERINQLVYTNATKIVSLSTEMKDYILNIGLIGNSSKIEIISNWYDANKLEYGLIRSKEIKNLKNDGKFIVLYSGNMGICQDMDTIVKCAIQLRNYNNILFVFTGHGNKVALIKKKIKDNELYNIIFYDFLFGSDYSDMLQVADCHLVSLEIGIEGLGVPSKTYSYLAAGRPLLAVMSKNTDIARMLNKYNAGYTFAQGDVGGLSSAILSLSADREKCIRMGENARKAFLDLYERNICTDKYCRMLTSILQS